MKFYRETDDRVILLHKPHPSDVMKTGAVKDLVDFECADLSKVEESFHEAVDEYLEFCKEVGREPEKEYKGTFNIRITPELHKKLVVVAMKNGDTLNATVEKAITKYVSK